MSNKGKITIISEDKIIIRTDTVWYAVSKKFLDEQVKFSKNPVFKEALQLLEKNKSKYVGL